MNKKPKIIVKVGPSPLLRATVASLLAAVQTRYTQEKITTTFSYGHDALRLDATERGLGGLNVGSYARYTSGSEWRDYALYDATTDLSGLIAYLESLPEEVRIENFTSTGGVAIVQKDEVEIYNAGGKTRISRAKLQEALEAFK